MRKSIAIATAMIIAGAAGAATANDEGNERHVVQGRKLAWKAPKPAEPYALTGTPAQAPQNEKGVTQRTMGRAGYRTQAAR